jgi:hypothetical protein
MTNEVKVTKKRQAEISVTLGPHVYILRAAVYEGESPYFWVYSGPSGNWEFTEGLWQRMRDAVDKLFAALKAS